METSIDDVFGSQGILSQHFSGYRPREGQIQMAWAVDDALRFGNHLVVEGPTGVGKSMGMLVPVIKYCVENNCKAIYGTANIALQEQLIQKDLPFLQKALPWDFRFSLRKGKGNYLCESKHSAFLMKAEGDLFGAKKTVEHSSEMDQILNWAETTETGDKSELPFIPSGQAWSRMSVGPDDCKGKKCRWFKNCHAVRAAEQSKNAEIVVVNHHLVFADIKYGRAVLPPHSIVILDEAHEAASIARDFLGFRLAEGTFKRLRSRMRKFDLEQEGEAVADAGQKFFADLDRFYRSRDYDTRITKKDCVQSDQVRAALEEARDKLGGLAKNAFDDDAAASLEVEAIRAAAALEIVSQAMRLDDDNIIVHLSEIDEDRLAIEGKPLDVSGLLRATLFEESTVICASATITVGGEFDHFIRDIGAPAPEELVVESPFLPENRSLIVPADMIPPKLQGRNIHWRERKAHEDKWAEQTCKLLEQTIRLAGGRTLGLFTSHNMLKRAAEHMDIYLSGFRVLVQGDMPRMQLVAEFQKDVRSVLLGTRSFWAGVDVPGESLSCVVIDKMPFAHPKDPIQAAWQEKLGRKMFGARQLPEMIIQLKQGAGRLIRSETDRGVIVMLDSRFCDKGYGRQALSGLGPMKLQRDLEAITEFLGSAPAEPAVDGSANWGDYGGGYGRAEPDSEIPF